MIVVDNLAKSYGPRAAVKNLNFQVNSGEVVGFLGPNGAGKSTTMNILAGVFPASSGKVTIAGHDIYENAIATRQLIGYLPETPPLYQEMVVEKYLEFTARLRKVPSSKINSAVDRVADRCMLKDVRQRIIGKLSKGFQQRVGLAQAMIHDPEILILDEPTIGLDPIQIIEIRKLIQELGESHTILLSSHILPEITQICQRVIIINEGEIAATDTLEGLTASLRKSVRLKLKILRPDESATELLSRVPSIISVTCEDDNGFTIECEHSSHPQEDIARLVLEQGWGLEELKPLSMSLEDIFLKLTTEEAGVIP